MMRLWHSVVALCVGGLVSAADHGNQTDACIALAATFPGKVAYANSTSYIQSNNYWSQQQAQVHPQCFVTPRSTDDVSIIIKILTSRNTPFTVKGGGHVPFAGASNIADGVTIDLVYLNAIVVSDDRQTVSVGPGNRWINVSEALDPLNLAVVGGRAADVGVSGFVLGCGISYFSGFRGWACDNVRNFELVVASGDIVNASPTTNPDLYWALRGGGGSNFGVVTRFDLATFEQGDLWGNTVVFPGSLNTTLIPLFQQLNFEGLPSDTAAHTFFDLSYQPKLGQYVINANFFHASPPPSNSTPAVFAPFQSIAGAISNSTTVAKISTHFNNIKIPYGFRQTWSNTIVSATPQSLPLLADIVSLFEARNIPLLAASKKGTLTPFLVFQFIPVNLLSQMQKDGGNTYGLKASDGPFFILSLVTTWEEPDLDALIDKSTQELIEKMENLAKERNLGTGHVFMNYAGREQQVQKRFGKDIDCKLKQISRKWDPRRKFARLWTGFFKLDE